MSDTVESLRRKIDSAGDLQSVVQTMKAVAAGSISQYEQSVRSLADYNHAVELGLAACFRDGPHAPQPARATPQPVRAVVFGSDQGLVGQFNDVVATYAVKTLAALPPNPEVWAVGERVHARLAEDGLPLRGLFHVPGSVEAVTPLIGQLLIEAGTAGDPHESTALYLFYNRPTAGGVYEPVEMQLLPLDERWRHRIASMPWPTPNLAEVLAPATTLPALIREYLFVSLYRACVESLASENSSRLAAMERAEKNIDELLVDLNGTFHRLRQATIDEELFDVVAGFEALSKRRS